VGHFATLPVSSLDWNVRTKDKMERTWKEPIMVPSKHCPSFYPGVGTEENHENLRAANVLTDIQHNHLPKSNATASLTHSIDLFGISIEYCHEI
jgi:hypothetical protein